MSDPLASGGAPGQFRALDLPGYTVDQDTGKIYYYGQLAQPGSYESALSAFQSDKLRQDQQLRATPTNSSSSSSSVSQSFQDPRALDLQAEELRMRQQQIQAEIARNSVLDQFARDKFAYEKQQGNSADARAAQALQEQIQARQTNNQLQMAQLRYEAGVTQAQLDFQAQQANARAQSEAQQINEQRRQFNLEQRRGTANDIANFAKNPGDVGANASYLLAGGAAPAGLGSLSTQMAQGADARTPQALVPLDLLLNTRNELAQGPQLFQPSMVSAPRVGMPDFSGLQQGLMPPSMAGNSGGVPAIGGGGGYGGFNGIGAVAAFNNQVSSGQPFDAGAAIRAFNAGTPGEGGPGGMAQGGATTAPLFKGNEQGAELFLNPTNAPIIVIPADQTKQMTQGKQMPGYADGTLDFLSQPVSDLNPVQGATPSSNNQSLGQLFYNSSDTSQIDPGTDASYQRSLGFLNSALGIARRGGPFAQGQLPTPVGVSAPGTNPFVQQYAAALAALGQGINPGLFLGEAQAAAPVGLSGAPVRRTR